MSAHAHDLRRRPAARKPQLRVVNKRKARKLRIESLRGASVLIGGGLAAAAIVAIILLEQVVLVQSAFHLSDLRKQLEVAEEKHEALVLEASTLDSSARIERYARENLGMVNPAPEGVEYIVADIKQPKQFRDTLARRHRTTVPTEGIAAGAYGGP